MAHQYAKGGLVQMRSLAVRRSKTTGHRTKTEQSIGRFIKYDGWVYAKPKHPTATIEWLTGRTEHPVSYVQRIRLDYIEPLGDTTITRRARMQCHHIVWWYAKRYGYKSEQHCAACWRYL